MADEDQPPYADDYDFAAIHRDGGVLEVRFHTEGGPWEWTTRVHRYLPQLFRAIADDHRNRVVLLTGTGASWCGPVASGGVPTGVSARAWDRVLGEGRALLGNLLDIPVPVVAAVNGPAVRHPEIPLLCDIVVASETATFLDSAHYPNGLVPGDGVHVVFPLLLGLNRGRYALMTGETIDAPRALDLGLVGEVLPVGDVLPRARELARGIAERQPMMVRYTRMLFTEILRERLHHLLGLGLAREGLAAVASSEDS